MSTATWRGDQIRGAVERAAKKGLRQAGEHVLEEANRTIPHQTGHMAGTGRATEFPGLMVIVSYDTPYALKQHEDTRLRHAPGRRAKWLERTLDEQRRAVIRFLRKTIKAAL